MNRNLKSNLTTHQAGRVLNADERRAVAAALALSRRVKFVYVSTNGAGGYPNTRVMLRFVPERGRYYHGLRIVDFDASTPLAPAAGARRAGRAR